MADIYSIILDGLQFPGATAFLHLSPDPGDQGVKPLSWRLYEVDKDGNILRGTAEVSGTFGDTKVEFNWEGPSNEGTYYYVVTFHDDNLGESAPSNIFTYVLDGEGAGEGESAASRQAPPDGVFNFVSADPYQGGDPNTEIKLAWFWTDGPFEPADGFNIYQDGEGIASVPISTTEFIVSNLSPGTSYSYVLTAFNSVGEGENTGNASARTEEGATNQPPDATDLSVETEQNNSISGQCPATDPDDPPESLSYGLVQEPSNGAASVTSQGTFTYTPGSEFVGSDYFVFVVSDPDGATDTAIVSIEVSLPNGPPVLTLEGNNPDTVSPDDTSTYTEPGATAEDPEEGDISTNIVYPDPYPSLAYSGTYSLTYSVTDSDGGSDTKTREVNIRLRSPENLTAEATWDRVVINFDPITPPSSSDPGYAGPSSIEYYIVVYDADGNYITGWSGITPGQLPWGDSGDWVVPGAFLTYTASSSDSMGNYSASLETNTVEVEVPEQPTVPQEAPHLVSDRICPHASTQIKLDWSWPGQTDPTDYTGFRVYRCDYSGATLIPRNSYAVLQYPPAFEVHGNAPINQAIPSDLIDGLTTISGGGLLATAVDSDGDGVKDSWVGTLLELVPGETYTVSTANGDVYFYWATPSEPRSTRDAGGESGPERDCVLLVDIPNTDVFSYIDGVDTPLDPDMGYEYYVVAYNENGEGPYSNPTVRFTEPVCVGLDILLSDPVSAMSNTGVHLEVQGSFDTWFWSTDPIGDLSEGDSLEDWGTQVVTGAYTFIPLPANSTPEENHTIYAAAADCCNNLCGGALSAEFHLYPGISAVEITVDHHGNDPDNGVYGNGDMDIVTLAYTLEGDFDAVRIGLSSPPGAAVDTDLSAWNVEVTESTGTIVLSDMSGSDGDYSVWTAGVDEDDHLAGDYASTDVHVEGGISSATAEAIEGTFHTDDPNAKLVIHDSAGGWTRARYSVDTPVPMPSGSYEPGLTLSDWGTAVEPETVGDVTEVDIVVPDWGSHIVYVVAVDANDRQIGAGASDSVYIERLPRTGVTEISFTGTQDSEVTVEFAGDYDHVRYSPHACVPIMGSSADLSSWGVALDPGVTSVNVPYVPGKRLFLYAAGLDENSILIGCARLNIFMDPAVPAIQVTLPGAGELDFDNLLVGYQTIAGAGDQPDTVEPLYTTAAIIGARFNFSEASTIAYINATYGPGDPGGTTMPVIMTRLGEYQTYQGAILRAGLSFDMDTALADNFEAVDSDAALTITNDSFYNFGAVAHTLGVTTSFAGTRLKSAMTKGYINVEQYNSAVLGGQLAHCAHRTILNPEVPVDGFGLKDLSFRSWRENTGTKWRDLYDDSMVLKMPNAPTVAHLRTPPVVMPNRPKQTQAVKREIGGEEPPPINVADWVSGDRGGYAVANLDWQFREQLFYGTPIDTTPDVPGEPNVEFMYFGLLTDGLHVIMTTLEDYGAGGLAPAPDGEGLYAGLRIGNPTDYPDVTLQEEVQAIYDGEVYTFARAEVIEYLIQFADINGFELES